MIFELGFSLFLVIAVFFLERFSRSRQKETWNPEVVWQQVLPRDFAMFMLAVNDTKLIGGPNIPRVQSMLQEFSSLLHLVVQDSPLAVEYVDTYDEMKASMDAYDTNGVGIFWKNADADDAFESPDIDIYLTCILKCPYQSIYQLIRAHIAKQAMKLYEEEKELVWSEVSLFRNDISRGMASTALVGDVLRERGRIHTPELTTQGVAAKAWVRKGQELYLYKIGKKELAASAVLDTLGFAHVPYQKVEGEELDRVVTARRKERIRALDERVVKCRLIASEEHSMVSFEDFQIYCQENGKNVFEETLALDRLHYLEMQIADYILNNIDRHGANWGFFMDNETGRLEKLYPLMDHDQAFSDVEGMRSQTTEQNLDLETAALLAQTELHADLGRILQMAQPEGISEKQWAQVQRRAAELDERCRIYESEL